MGLYGYEGLKLPLTSLMEEFKCAKVRFQMALDESRDLVVSSNASPLTAGCKGKTSQIS